MVSIEARVLEHNDTIAAENRQWFAQHGIRVLNMMSAPGAGKTALLERTLTEMSSTTNLRIITGDVEGDFDAQRLRARGGSVLSLRTEGACHLDASMIRAQLGTFVPPERGTLIIENVGNLVCPAAFDLGEHERVALVSTTEGEDKPAKYPLLFHRADVIVLTKMDLVPHLDWDIDVFERHVRSVNPRARRMNVSARSGEGMREWLAYVMS